MFKKYNAHPEGLVRCDHIVRQITTVTNGDYYKIAKKIERIKTENGKNHWIDHRYSLRFNCVYEYFKDYPRIIIKQEKGKPRIRVKEFVKENPKGTYLIKMARNITACVDGVLMDTIDYSDFCIFSAWVIKK